MGLRQWHSGTAARADHQGGTSRRDGLLDVRVVGALPDEQWSLDLVGLEKRRA
jgi:hypothetical protein